MENIENLLKYFELLENQTRDKCAEKYRDEAMRHADSLNNHFSKNKFADTEKTRIFASH